MQAWRSASDSGGCRQYARAFGPAGNSHDTRGMLSNIGNEGGYLAAFAATCWRTTLWWGMYEVYQKSFVLASFLAFAKHHHRCMHVGFLKWLCGRVWLLLTGVVHVLMTAVLSSFQFEHIWGFE